MSHDSTTGLWSAHTRPAPGRLHRFKHYAMAAEFEIIPGHSSEQYGAQAAQAAFTELDRMEQDLSRFIENSDVSRINRLGRGQTLLIGPDAVNCLVAAAELYQLTGGAFDPGAGNLIQLFRDGLSGTPSGSLAGLQIDPVNHLVRKAQADCNIDLGAIGKGYALDRIDALLHEWSVTDFLIHGGQSTVKAAGRPDRTGTWKVSITDPDRGQVIAVIKLRSGAVSASGLRKGDHIIDPRTGLVPKSGRYTWVMSESAAWADALSTAFMMLDLSEIARICETCPTVKAGLIEAGEYVDFGLMRSE